MVHWANGPKVKVELVAYVSPGVKRAMKIAATLEQCTVSDGIQRLCTEYLLNREDIRQLVEKED